MIATDRSAAAIYVSYRTGALDLSWIPEDVEVIVVHNDDSLGAERAPHPGVRHLRAGRNVGFGAGVNLALDAIAARRAVICNPDTALRREHWNALADAPDDELRVVPLVDAAGNATSVVNRYPTAASMVATGWRLGRLLPRHGIARRVLAPLLGAWGREHADLMRRDAAGRWPLATHWASGAVLSVAASRLRTVGGFDEAYFLYFEDVDLCRRLATRFPDMSVVMPEIAPAVHGVGGSAPGRRARRAAARHHLESARRYTRSQRGVVWRLGGVLLWPRSVWLKPRRDAGRA